MPLLTARTLITSIGEVLYPAIEIGEDGLIGDVASDPSSRADTILTPAFLDIHLHGAAGEDVMSSTPDGFSRIGRFLGSRGTSHYLPTTVTAPVETTLAALERIAGRIEQPTASDEAIPLGIHLEGPFLSHGKRGVHPMAELQPPSIELFDRFQQAARGHIRLLTLAPELPGVLDLIQHATGQGVRVSLGHTDATAAQAQAAIAAGACSATHTFNAMRAFDHREPGILAVVLNTPSLFAELICDGVHVAPAAVELWWKLKGDHALLVTDGISATGMPDGEYHLGPLAVTVRAPRCTLAGSPQILAGSVLTLDHAVSNLRRYTGCSLAEAVRAASSQPARMLGVDGTITSLRPGQPASFNQFSASGGLQATWLRGVEVHANR